MDAIKEKELNQGSGLRSLVNYGQGIRQSKKGGRMLVKGMAPIMEFNDVGDDPYVMRNPVA